MKTIIIITALFLAACQKPPDFIAGTFDIEKQIDQTWSGNKLIKSDTLNWPGITWIFFDDGTGQVHYCSKSSTFLYTKDKDYIYISTPTCLKSTWYIFVRTPNTLAIEHVTLSGNKREIYFRKP